MAMPLPPPVARRPAASAARRPITPVRDRDEPAERHEPEPSQSKPINGFTCSRTLHATSPSGSPSATNTSRTTFVSIAASVIGSRCT